MVWLNDSMKGVFGPVAPKGLSHILSHSGLTLQSFAKQDAKAILLDGPRQRLRNN